MRLKLLILLLAWVTTSNVIAQDKKCLHDGYSNNNTCMCRQNNGKNLFSGKNCENRIVYNDGSLRSISASLQTTFDKGCFCPPGFLGANCEPTKCIAGESQSFYLDQTDQSISFFITYNLDMVTKTKIDDVVQAICNGFALSKAKQLLFVTGAMPNFGNPFIQNSKDAAQCVTAFNDAVKGLCGDDDPSPTYCPRSNVIDLQTISDMLDSTFPNSELYLVTNYPINPTSEDIGLVPSVIRKAVSRRIRINIFAFSTPSVMDKDSFITSTGYQILRTIAESTLGIFSTPYWGTTDMKLLGNASVSQAITSMMKLRNDGFTPTKVLSTTNSALQIVPLGESKTYYVAVRAEDVNLYTGTFFNFTQVPEQKWDDAVFIDTGYWRLYNITQTTYSSLTYSISNTAFITPVNYVLYTKISPSVFPAVSNNLINDADAPFATINVETNLVGGAPNANQNIMSVMLFSPQLNYTNNAQGNATFSSAVPIQQRNCQFGYNLGKVNCISQGVLFLQTQFSDGSSSATPFFCSGPDTNSNLLQLSEMEDSSIQNSRLSVDDTQCQNDVQSKTLAESSGSRTFAILSRNVRYLNDPENPIVATDYSPVDRLYYNPNNIFDYLFNLINSNQTFYSKYYAVLVKSGAETSPDSAYGDDLSSFINDVMDKTGNAETDFDKVNNSINWFLALDYTVKQMRETIKTTYSDLFVVIDYGDYTTITSNSNFYTFFENVLTARTRVYFLTVESLEQFIPNSIAVDPLQQLSIIAGQTGGGLYRLKDFTDLQRFFDIYFDVKQNGSALLGADIVYQRLYPYGKSIPFLTTETFNLPAKLSENEVKYFLHIYGSNPPMTMAFSCNNTFNGTINPSHGDIFGEQYRYDLGDMTGRTGCKITVTYLPISFGVSMVIYVSSSKPITQFTNIAFTDAPLTNAIDSQYGAFLEFGKTTDQYPVSTQDGQIIIKNSSGILIFSSTFTNRECTPFSSYLDFNFKCPSKNDFYYFYTTFTDKDDTHSRAYVTQCLSSDKNCSIGYAAADGTCVCPPQYTGALCDTPICLNGGTVTAGKKCDCTANFAGLFCENAINNSCSNSPRIPDIRSEISSVIFVVEKIGKPLLINSPTILPGVQISFVQFDCNPPVTRLVSTDVTKLDALWENNIINSSCNSVLTNNNAIDALIQGLDTQIAPRALVVLVSSGNFSFGSRQADLMNRLSKQRVDIRIFSDSQQPASQDLKTLATLGNGIIYTNDFINNFQSYYNNYVWSIVPNSVALTSANIQKISRLSVVSFGNGSNDFSLPGEAADSIGTIYFVHLTGKGAKATFLTGCSNTPTFTPTSTSPTATTTTISSCSYSEGAVTISIENADSYSIEKMTTVQLAYGFQSSGLDEKLNIGMAYSETDFLSFYTSQSDLGTDYSNFASVTVTPISMNGTLQQSTLLSLTKKNGTDCKYPYFTTPISCNSSSLGFVAQFITNAIGTESGTPVKRFEQKIFVCANNTVVPTTAIPTTTTAIPTTTTAPTTRSLAFILDSKGGDPNIYGTIKNTVTDFLSGFDDNLEVMIMSQDATTNITVAPATSKFVKKKDLNLNDTLNYLTYMRFYTDDNSDADISPALKVIHTAYQDGSPIKTSDFALNTDVNVIFYLTQSGMVSIDTTSKTNVQNDGFALRAVFYNGNVDKSVALQSVTQTFGTENMTIFSSIQEATGWMKGQTQGAPSTFAPAPTPRASQPACVNKVQGSMYTLFELSNVANLDQTFVNNTNLSYQQFFKLFPSDFELGDAYQYTIYYNTTTMDSKACNLSLSRFNDLTQMTGFGFSGTKILGQQPNLCNNNYPSLEPYVKLPGTDKNFVPNLSTLSTFFNQQFSEPCKCSRLNDIKTVKFAVWLVFTLPDKTNATKIISSFTNNEYLHAVITFGAAANPQNGDFYYELAKFSLNNPKTPVTGLGLDINSFLFNGDTTPISTIIQSIWTTICRVNSVLDTSTTSIPPLNGNKEYFRRYWLENNINFENFNGNF